MSAKSAGASPSHPPPLLFHRGLTIVIDTREQLPYTFPCPTIRKTLRTGDYSILDAETRVAIERKRPDELFTCFGAQRDRFRREFERLSTYEYAAVIIEGDLTDVLTPHFRSTVSHRTVINSLISWSIRFGVHVWFATDREHAIAMTFRLLQKFAEQDVRKKAADLLTAPDVDM